jgi:uncharacterized spore protein YtfJ
MEKKEATIANPVTVAGVTLILVSKVAINCWQGKRGVTFSGSKQPDSIVIVTPSAKRAFRITGEEIAFDQIVREIPGIMKTLQVLPESYRATPT